MSKHNTYRVKDVARLTGVSVRALHHYDAIGLLAPAARSAKGHRLYDTASLLRLQQILVRRALGFPLEDIRKALDDPAFDIRAALAAQRAQLQARAQDTARMIRTIEDTLSLLDRKESAVANGDMKRMFDGFDPSRHQAEAERRWGATDAYKESAKRTKRYTAADWEAIKAEQAGIYRAAYAALAAGAAPGDPAAMDAADAHRRFIDRWFYPCGFALHKGLADLWEADPRFAENIDKFGAGLTPFLAAAVRANAGRFGR